MYLLTLAYERISARIQIRFQYKLLYYIVENKNTKKRRDIILLTPSQMLHNHHKCRFTCANYSFLRWSYFMGSFIDMYDECVCVCAMLTG